MTDTNWAIKAREFLHCNCDYGCPCQFNSRPTKGDCRGVLAIDIEQGHHGNTKLDGLKVAAVVSWPGAIHKGHGTIQPIVDERATPQQREALLRIMSGLDTEPGATIFQVFSATYDKVHDPIFKAIELNIDVEGRRATLKVPNIIEGRGEPIRNPVTGLDHQVLINLPKGFEYTTAEVGRGWTKTAGAIALNLEDSHAHFAHLHMTQSGVVR
jgi:hypothetical protein